MARAYSQDLRDRVIDAALSGLPARHAAARFGVGVATAIVWVRRFRESGERQARKQGQVSRRLPLSFFFSTSVRCGGWAMRHSRLGREFLRHLSSACALVSRQATPRA